MSLTAFLQDLADTGRVRVGREPESAVDSAVDELLRGLDHRTRLEMPGEAPPLSLPAARWAAEILHSACRLLVHRDLDAALVELDLSRSCPERPSQGVVYSADLLLRHLPEVHALARGFAPDDPLVAALLRLAHDWPFSSVGIANVGAVDVSAFIDHPSLRQEYLDRVIARGDKQRLSGSALELDAMLSSSASLEERERALTSCLAGGSA